VRTIVRGWTHTCALEVGFSWAIMRHRQAVVGVTLPPNMRLKLPGFGWEELAFLAADLCFVSAVHRLRQHALRPQLKREPLGSVTSVARPQVVPRPRRRPRRALGSRAPAQSTVQCGYGMPMP